MVAMKRILTKESVIEALRKELPYLRDEYGVERICIFGSFARGLQRGRSDIDILIELKKPLGLGFVKLAYYLEESLGRKVDVATFECLERSFSNPRYKHIAEDIKKSLIYV